MIYVDAEGEGEDKVALGRLHLLSGLLAASVVGGVLRRLPASVSPEAAAALREAWVAGLASEPGPAFRPGDERRRTPTEHRGGRRLSECSGIPSRRAQRLHGGRPVEIMERPSLGGSADRRVGGRDPDLVFLRRAAAGGDPVFSPGFVTEDRPPRPSSASSAAPDYRIVECCAVPLLGCPVRVRRPDGSLAEARISLVLAGGGRVSLRLPNSDEEPRVDWPDTAAAEVDAGLGLRELAAAEEEQDADSIGVDDELLRGLDLSPALDSADDADALSEDDNDDEEEPVFNAPAADATAEAQRVRVVPLDRQDRERYLSTRRRLNLVTPLPSTCADNDTDLADEIPSPESVVIASCRKVMLLSPDHIRSMIPRRPSAPLPAGGSSCDRPTFSRRAARTYSSPRARCGWTPA